MERIDKVMMQLEQKLVNISHPSRYRCRKVVATGVEHIAECASRPKIETLGVTRKNAEPERPKDCIQIFESRMGCVRIVIEYALDIYESDAALAQRLRGTGQHFAFKTFDIDFKYVNAVDLMTVHNTIDCVHRYRNGGERRR